jgi:hypothetical protein
MTYDDVIALMLMSQSSSLLKAIHIGCHSDCVGSHPYRLSQRAMRDGDVGRNSIRLRCVAMMLELIVER